MRTALIALLWASMACAQQPTMRFQNQDGQWVEPKPHGINYPDGRFEPLTTQQESELERRVARQQVELIWELAAEETPDGHSGKIGSSKPPTPHPSDEWKRAYRQLHGKEWRLGANSDAEKYRTPWAQHDWRIQKGYVKGSSPRSVAIKTDARDNTIRELRAEIAKLNDRIRRLETSGR